MNSSDTPRTNAEVEIRKFDSCSFQLSCMTELTRRIERELNVQIETCNNLKEHIRILNFGASDLVYKKK